MTKTRGETDPTLVVQDFISSYQAEYRSVVALAAVLSGNRWAAEDLAQAAFSAVHRQWDKVGRYVHSHLWIRKGVANKSVSSIRRSAAQAGSELGIVAVGNLGAIWYSEDGKEWTPVLAPLNVRWADSAVGASDSGFIVASGHENGTEVVTSQDGTTWTPTANTEGWISMREAIPLGDGFMVATEGGPSPIHICEP